MDGLTASIIIVTADIATNTLRILPLGAAPNI